MVESDKSLILLTDNYPVSNGEFFIDDEIVYLAEGFKKIFVLVSNPGETSVQRVIPSNVEVIPFELKTTAVFKLKGIFRTLNPAFGKELAFALSKASAKYWSNWSMIFKIMYMDWLKASKLKGYLRQFMRARNLDTQDVVLYSYWHDYKALALAMMKHGNREYKCIARAHRWDVFLDTHPIPYLPFKRYILKNLSCTYSISQTGKDWFINKYAPDKNARIEIARLGKNNAFLPTHNLTPGFILCTCSSLIPLKRVDLIIDVLSYLQDLPITWVHFGDGPVKDEILEYANKKIPRLRFCFKGVMPNAEILNYYHDHDVDMFINLSRSEGIPVSIMEALSAGIPVLATDVGGTSEIVNAQNGFLIESNPDAEKTAMLIRNYLMSPDETKLRYRENAYNFWKNNYNAEQNYRSFVSEIREIQ